jgi:Carbohydrate-binding module 48 (Isoamylase N-terminal domain)
MNDYLISLYIDNELDLDQKITFVEIVHQDGPFTDEALAMLRQEQQLRTCWTEPPFVAVTIPTRTITKPTFNPFSNWFKPVGGLVLAALIAGLLFLFQPHPTSTVHQETQQRFVLYLPESQQASIVGTFTGWKPIPMERIGTSGYWSLTLSVPLGEHRYSYLIEENRRIADPTVVTKEQDDFGGENSVIQIRMII